eukprot:1368970-Amorphochlora_amoeboformis.AAC.1
MSWYRQRVRTYRYAGLIPEIAGDRLTGTSRYYPVETEFQIIRREDVTSCHITLWNFPRRF